MLWINIRSAAAAAPRLEIELRRVYGAQADVMPPLGKRAGCENCIGSIMYERGSCVVRARARTREHARD